MNEPKTRFANGTNPFMPVVVKPEKKEPAAKKVEAKSVAKKSPQRIRTLPMTFVDVDTLKVSREPMPVSIEQKNLKYTTFFSKMVEGDCIQCKWHEVSSISQALKSYLKREKKKGLWVRVKISYPTKSEGRVWLIKEQK